MKTLWRRLLFLIRRDRAYSELREELAAHQQLLADDLSHRGLALDAVRRQMGNVTYQQEECRNMWSFLSIERLLQDLRYASRNLARNPGFALVTILTLALGIGANTTIFSLINSTLLQRLPFPNADRIMTIWQTSGKGPGNENIVSAPNFWDFKRQAQSFESMAILDSGGKGYSLSASGATQDAEQVSGVRVSAEFFKVLGVKPLIGREFLPEEEQPGHEHEVILSYGLWKSRYAGDRSLVGKTIRIDSAPYTVVGVMPPTFSWQFWSGGPRKLWVPVGYTKTDFGRGDNSFIAIGRLRPGIKPEHGEAEINAIAAGIAKQFPGDDANMGAKLWPLSEVGMEGVRRVLLTLFAAVGLILLIACVNVANLLLARGAERQKEFAIRRALGAPGLRIARQLLTESMLLALAGGVAGLLLANWSNQLLFRLLSLNQLNLPLRSINAISIDSRVFVFALLISCFTGLLFGVAPALSSLRVDVNEPLKEGGRSVRMSGRGRLRQLLVASEIALALIVLCAAGLMIKSMSRLLGLYPGFNACNVLVSGVSVPQEEIYVGPPGLPNFCRDVGEHLSAVPGVLSVSAGAHLPLMGSAGRGFQIEGRPASPPGDLPGANYSVACPNYFHTMGIPLLEGREFDFKDTLGAPAVIVINRAMARQYWPKEDPIGKAIRLGGSSGPRLIVVGVVGDVYQAALDAPLRPQFMRPYMQAGWPIMSLVVRTAADPLRFVPSIRKSLAEALPDHPTSDLMMLEKIVHDSTGSHRLPMLLLSAFSLLALTLAAVGIVGVVAHSVSQRTSEIGVRMALGASQRDILRLVIGGSMRWIIGGLLAGLVVAASVSHVLASMLFEVHPLDPTVLTLVSLLLLAVALLASYLPARRAARIDPVTALRTE